MTKEESTILKGVAILMMLFLHLFCKQSSIEDYHSIINISDKPLVFLLARATSPVFVFILLSGYGHAFQNFKNGFSLSAQMKRLLKLYIHYWMILAVFVTIGAFLQPSRYPGTVSDAVLNILSWKNNYNYETWFLFPYAIISLCSGLIIKTINKFGNKKSIVAAFIITLCAQFVTSRVIAAYKIYDSLLAHIICPMNLLFGFVTGIVMFNERKQLLRIKDYFSGKNKTLAILSY